MADINGADPKRSGTYRAALAAVIFLSALLVLAVLAVVAGFIRQYRLYRQDAAPQAPAEADKAPVSIELAPGVHIVSASTDAGKLVLQVQTPQGSEVDILDLKTGMMMEQVKDGQK